MSPNPGSPSDLHCGLVLLAAGASRRMGSPKQLIEIDGRPLLVRAVEAALAAPVWPVVVVLGANGKVGQAAVQIAARAGAKVIAVQHAPMGIRANTVVPGQLHTPMVEVRLAKQRTGGDVDALLASRVKRIPLGFMGDGRDTASAALFLASDEAQFITGTEIIVDGGMTARCD